MTPDDLSTRLRALIQLPLPEVRPVTPARRTPDDHLPPGTRFTAQIQERLPNGSFRALVANHSVTLTLPQPANPGQTLELVAARQTTQTLFARIAEPSSLPTPRPELSQTGRLVSQFAAGSFGDTPPAPLKGGTPLLSAPPATPAAVAQLATALSRALASSGVFYEAHQARWVAGQMPLDVLQKEPQAQLPQRPLFSTLLVGRELASRDATGQVQSGAQVTLDTLTRAMAELRPTPLPGTALPREIAPVVLQQLDSLLNQQLAMQGVAWPGQPMLWTVDVPERDPDGSAEGEAPVEWKTTLKLSMPSLGEVEASLRLGPAGLALRLRATDPESAPRLRGELGALASALEAHGILPAGNWVVDHDEA